MVETVLPSLRVQCDCHLHRSEKSPIYISYTYLIYMLVNMYGMHLVQLVCEIIVMLTYYIYEKV